MRVHFLKCAQQSFVDVSAILFKRQGLDLGIVFSDFPIMSLRARPVTSFNLAKRNMHWDFYY